MILAPALRYQSRGSIRKGKLCLRWAVPFVIGAIVPSFLQGVEAQDLEVSNIEDMVIDDCDHAGLMIGHLGHYDQRRALLKVVQIFRLGFGRGSSLGAIPIGVGSPSIGQRLGHGELLGEVVVMSLDPDRIERGKRCSVKLLETFIPQCPDILPDLIELSRDPDLKLQDLGSMSDLHRLVEMGIERVGSSINTLDRRRILEKILEDKTPEVLGEWKNIFNYFRPESLELLSERVLVSPMIDERVLEILGESFPDLDKIFPTLILRWVQEKDRIPQGRLVDIFNKLRLNENSALPLILSYCASSSGQALPELLELIADIVPAETSGRAASTSVLVRDSVFHLMSSWAIKLHEGFRCGRVGISCDSSSVVVNNQGSESDTCPRSGVSSLWCDPQSLGRYRELFHEKLDADDPGVAAILPAYASLPISLAALIDDLRHTLRSNHREVRYAGICLYGAYLDDLSRFVSEGLRLIKRPIVGEEEKRDIIRILAKVIARYPAGIQGLAAVPLFLDYSFILDKDCENFCGDGGIPLGSKAIGSVGASAFPMLVRSLKSNDPSKRRFAFESLAQIRNLDRRMALILVEGLKDPDRSIRDVIFRRIYSRRSEVEIRDQLFRAQAWEDKEAAANVGALLKN